MESLEARRLLSIVVWDGGSVVNANWQTAANWVGDVAPVAGDNLVFPTGVTTNLSNTNNFPAGTGFGSIQIVGDGYTLAGSGVTLANGISNSGLGNVVQLPITLGASQTFTNNSTLTLSGGITLAGRDLTFDGSGTTQVTSAIAGSGNLVKQGGGTLDLGVANSYGGVTTIKAGTLRALNAQSLGAADSTAATETVLQNGGTLLVGTGVTVSSGERLHVNGPTNCSFSGEGSGSTWGGNMLMEANNGAYLYLYLGGTLTVQGSLSDTGSGNNVLYVSSSSVITLNGVVSLDYIYNNYSNLTLAANATVTSQFYTNNSTTTISNSTLSTPYYYCDWNSNVALSHGTLSYTNSYFNSTLTSLSGIGTVQNGTTLPVASVSPGLTAGAAGVLSTKNINLSGSYTVDLAGATPGEGSGHHDQLQVTGTVQAGGTVSVSIAGGYTPGMGQIYVLIDNDGADAISGTFTGLSEGSLLVAGTTVFRASYLGGDGNDFTLTRVAAKVWDGKPDGGGSSANANWQTASNWVGDAAPVAGDNLVFPTGVTTNLSNTNDFPAGTGFGAIQILGGNYTLAGNAITLANGINNSGSGNAVQLPVTLGASQTFSNSSTLTFSGGIALAGRDLTFDGSGTTQVSTAITGSGNLVKQGGGTLALGVANSYGGVTTIKAGVLRALHAQSLGAADGTAATETILQDSGRLWVGTGITVSSSERLHATGSTACYLNGEGTGATWGGNVLMEANSGAYLYQYLQGTLTVQGGISDTGPGYSLLYVYSSATVTLNGAVSLDYIYNSYSNLTLSANATVTSQFYTNNSTTTISNSTLSTPYYYCDWNSNVALSHGTLSYTNSYVNSTLTNLSGIGAVQNGATLPVANVSPGLSAGAAGVLSTKNINLSSSYTVDLAGATPGEGSGHHDQLQVAGTVQVGGTLSLSIAAGYTPGMGQTYVLIDNDGADAINGTFTGLAEGSLLVAGTTVFRASYLGGDGNDFTLTRVSAKVWDGAPDGGGTSADANWQTASNWVGDAAPMAGDNLIFPTGVTENLSNTNNFPAGTGFGAIQILGGNYTLAGNAITLANGINNSGSGNAVQLPVTLGASQTFSNSSTLTLSGGIALAGYDLTFDGNGTTQVSSAIAGSGNLVKQGGGLVALGVANSYGGLTTIKAGTLHALNALSLGDGDGTAATETVLQDGGTLLVGTGVSVSSGERLHVLGSTACYLNGEGTGSTWGGSVLMEASSGAYLYLYLHGTLTVQGSISDTGPDYNLLYAYSGANITLNGVVTLDYIYNTYSTLALSADATTTTQSYTSNSTTTIANATLSTPYYYCDWNSNLVLSHGTLNATSSYFFNSLSNLSGIGTIQVSPTLQVSNVSPGLSAGAAGVLSTGNVNVSGTYTVDLAGATPGEGSGHYDQLQVTGTVQVGGALSVSIAGGFTPVGGTVFTVINNDSDDAISGSFSGQAEGSLLTVGTTIFRVTYRGGDGNDMTLTAAETPGPVVTTTADVVDQFDGLTSLREAVSYANSHAGADTITFASGVSGTITLSQGQLSLSDTSGATTIAGPGAAVLAVSGNDATRLFMINHGVTAAISGLTMTHGAATAGGTGNQGGAIYNDGALTVNNCVFSANQANGGGGAIFKGWADSVAVDNCSFSNNTAAYAGGAIASDYHGTINVSNSSFTGNSAGNSPSQGYGGAVNINYNVTSQISNSTFSNNSAVISGGGITNAEGYVTLTNCTIVANQVTGAIGQAQGGGGVRAGQNGGSLTATNCTIAGNSANVGGGLWASGQAVTLKNTIVAGNSNSDSSVPSPDVYGSLTATYSLIQNTTGASIAGGTGNITGQDPLLGALGNYGGPTQTKPLLSGSPAINAGTSSGAPATDQRGAPRDATPDMGAYEVVHNFVVTTTADEDNGTVNPALGTGASLREAINFANANPGADTITFALGSGTHSITLGLGQLTLSDTSGKTTITGPGASVLTVSGNNASRVFNISGGATTEISGLAITGGRADFGGAINNAGTATVANCSFSGNQASPGGGGINNSGTLSVNSSVFSANTARWGGGISNYGDLTVNLCTLDHNSATWGGAISNQMSCNATITQTTFLANSGAWGGSIYNDHAAALTLTGSTISESTATYGGGVIVASGTTTINNSTIAGNSAAFGGGVYVENGVAAVSNSIVAGNTNSDATSPDISGAVTADYCLIQDPTGATITGANNVVNQNPLLAALGTYGGPTQTRPLLPGSPAIDAGSNSLIPSGVTTDQRGLARIVRGTVDMGAVESSGFVLTVLGGDNQSGRVGRDFPTPLSVGAAGRNGEPVDGGVITFTAQTVGGATALFPSGAAATIQSGAASKVARANSVAGTYTVTAAAAGADAPSTFTLTNVVPTLSNLAVDTPITEGGTTTLTGTIVEPGVTEPHTVTIDWADGKPNTVLNLPAGDMTIPPTPHQYDDNRPSNAPYSITVAVADSDGVGTSSGVSVTVTNVTPAAAINSPPATAAVASPTSFTFTAVEPGLVDRLDLAYTIDWGDSVTQTIHGPATGITTSHVWTDFGTYLVSVYATDHDGAAGAAATANVDVPNTGTVTIDADAFGPNLDNRIAVRLIAGQLVVTVDGQTVLDTAAGGISLLSVDGGDGNDTLLVDISAHDTIPGGGLAYDGGAGQNSLAVLGSGNEAALYQPANAAGANGCRGTITIEGFPITFTGLAPIDLADLASVTVDPAGIDDQLQVADGSNLTSAIVSTVGSQAALVISGTTDGVDIETTAVWNVGQLVIDTAATGDQDGSDTVTVAGADGLAAAANVSALAITTGSVGADSVLVAGAVRVSGEVSITTHGSVSQTVAGTIVAPSLSVSAVQGAILNAANQIGAFTAQNTTSGDVELNNTATPLSIAGIAQSGGNVQVVNYGSLRITGAVTAPGRIVSLLERFSDIQETGSGRVDADLLITQSKSGALLGGLNTVANYLAWNDPSGGNMQLNNNGLLNIQVVINNGGGNLSVVNAGGIRITGTIKDEGGSVSLQDTTADIQEAGGLILAGQLTTQSVTGTILNGNNAVGTFQATNTTSGDLQFNNNANALLMVAGISQSGGNIQVINYGAAVAGSGLKITGTISNTTVGGIVSIKEFNADIEETGAGKVGGELLITQSKRGTLLNGANTITSFVAINDPSGGDVQLTNTAGPLWISSIVETGGNVSIVNAGGIRIPGTISAQGGTVSLQDTTADIQETGGLILANQLTTQSVTGTILNGNNAVGTFQATNTTSGDVQFNNNSNALLTVAGISEAGGNIQVINFGGVVAGAGIVIDGTVSTSHPGGMVSLKEWSADIQETENGAIVGGSLITQSKRGQLLTGANAVNGFYGINDPDGGDLWLKDDVPELIITQIIETGGNVRIDNTGLITLASGPGTIQATGTITLNPNGTGGGPPPPAAPPALLHDLVLLDWGGTP